MIFEDRIRAAVRSEFDTLNEKVYIYNEPTGPGQQREVFYFNADGSITVKAMDPGGEIPPSFYADGRVIRAILRAIANCAKKEGIPDETESYLKGKVEGMETHLSDMRRLVFEEPITISGKPINHDRD